MFYSESNFLYVVLVMNISFAAVGLFYHFKFKHDPQRTEFDNVLSNFKFVSVFFAALFFVSILYLPSTGMYSRVYLDDSPEQIMRQLARNQQDIAKDLDQLREVYYFILTITVLYFVGIGNFISTLQKVRRKELLENDTNLKKPLGL